mmetsp:Transcript_30641/g.82973  ORF Transcript_30641/g.82973 Transcript_30641/m.82973 type:complete len:258 (+) Transcript_30641:1509-2282(+)
MLLVVLAGLAHDDGRSLCELRTAEARQSLFSLLGEEVCPELGNDVVSLLSRGDRSQDPADAHVVEHREPKLHLHLVVRAAASLRLWLPDPTLGSPLSNLAVAKLCIARVLLDKVVNPIEEALLRHANREEHLAFPARGLRCLPDLHIRCCSIPQRAALEGELRQRHRSKVHLECHVLVGHGGKQHLPAQVLGQCLWLANPCAIPEEADGVCVGAARLEVEDHCHRLIIAKLLGDLSPPLLVGKVALGIKAHVVGPVR